MCAQCVTVIPRTRFWLAEQAQFSIASEAIRASFQKSSFDGRLSDHLVTIFVCLSTSGLEKNESYA
ncbi:MAG: hypothetical protein DME40_10165 [Verrucomicrobia bacterium]|nr:MAG: hypothetical protein DME40_10165 [Verrucomicrobiota bacterium]